MKRYETSLAAVLGVIAGLLGGFFLGQSFSGESSGSTAPAPAPAAKEEVAPGPLSETNARDWFKRYAGQFDRTDAKGATPGLTEAITDALQAEDLFAEGRMLMLIEMMKKEDFPVALQVLRKAKTGINGAGQGQNGPAMWKAFWIKFGQLDPAKALECALDSGDLQYTGRDTLEKWLFRGLAIANPENAAQAFLAHPELPNREEALQSVALIWSRKDTPAALAWAQQNITDPKLLARIYYGAGWGTSTGSDIAGGTAFLKDLPETAPRGQVIQALKDQIGQKPYVPAGQLLDFMGTLRSVGKRDPGFEMQMAKRVSKGDPFAAAEFFAKPLPDGTPNDYAGLRVVTSAWARSDSKAAEAWAKGQTGTPQYRVAAQEFARAAHERNDADAEQRWTEEAGKN